jgi:hypothetical protein
VLKAAEAAAKKDLKAMAEAFGKKPEDWLPRWYEFRRLHGGTEAARPLVEKYDGLRASQRAAGRDLFQKAYGYYQAKDREKGRAALQELLEKAPASYEAHRALKWLKEP